jgi:hypothetical protein
MGCLPTYLQEELKEMPTATFGFLADSATFEVDFPSDVDHSFEQRSSVGLAPEQALTIQCRRTPRALFRDFGWRRSFQISVLGGVPVDVYDCDDPPDVAMLVWDLEPWFAWVQLRGKPGQSLSDMLATFANGIEMTRDASEIPRLKLRRGLVPGNPYAEPLNRDSVSFNTRDASLVVLRRDGAFGVEGAFSDGNVGWAVATTQYGITIERSGSVEQRAELLEQTRTMAASLREATP